MKSKKVSCIIPAYNEEKTVVGIVKTCLKTPEIGEVIVVNDGSQDQTLEKLAVFGNKIKIIDLLHNQGKGYAVAQGIKATSCPYLLFLDADLINYQPHHLYSLITPVINNRADMTIGIPTNLRLPNNFYWRFSGQRCLTKKASLKLVKGIEKTNYGLEVILNEKFKNKRIITIPLVFNKKHHLIKTEKQQDWAASYTREVWEVFQKTISVKSASYREKIRKEFLNNLASYLKISYQKAKNYLVEVEK